MIPVYYHDPKHGWRVEGPGFNFGTISEAVARETATLLAQYRSLNP